MNDDPQFRAPCASTKGDIIFGDEMEAGFVRLTICMGPSEASMDLDRTQAQRLAKYLLAWARDLDCK